MVINEIVSTFFLPPPAQTCLIPKKLSPGQKYGYLVKTSQKIARVLYTTAKKNTTCRSNFKWWYPWGRFSFRSPVNPGWALKLCYVFEGIYFRFLGGWPCRCVNIVWKKYSVLCCMQPCACLSKEEMLIDIDDRPNTWELRCKLLSTLI